ncbi:alpha/beta fold hydrolase [Kibdelosporangium aridum]|uniref:Pimeloyl-ACP methyl ester carboxylesterase n=1 Tax=Kibdelosporangium aridum TaxID=2030 RepID=A0A1W2FLJ8_KIBAR|nr:alpha/beta hydrolase [Kibdelosporangium aridum]SMD22468.1 Pimeloyl-ACP methyl ester carboxylesterase [Kibdelosporangium aridum]
MPITTIDGILTRYEIVGDGPPLLMFSPGGFNASLETWRTQGIYRQLELLPQLAERYTCITFDKRETGESGGRVERIGWASYATQGVELLDHLGIERAHLMGGCIGCSIATTMAVAHPGRVSSLVLYSPAGGPRYRMGQHARLGRHLAYVAEHGLAAVVELARTTSSSFTQDPRVGPWVTVLRRDPAFAENYASLDAAKYAVIVTGMSRLLFDGDTVPGPEPEDLMLLDIPTLIVPGEDVSHAPSAARYLRECLPHAEFWDAPVAEQTAQTAPKRILEFLGSV